MVVVLRVADDALVGAAVFDAEQIGIDVDLHVVQSQIKNGIGEGKIIFDRVLLHIGRIQHPDAPFVCTVIHFRSSSFGTTMRLPIRREGKSAS